MILIDKSEEAPSPGQGGRCDRNITKCYPVSLSQPSSEIRSFSPELDPWASNKAEYKHRLAVHSPSNFIVYGALSFHKASRRFASLQ